MTSQAPTRGQQLSLAVFLCAAVASFGASYQQPAIWIYWLPSLLSLFWRIERVPEGVRNGARYLSWILLALTVVIGLNQISAASLFSPSAAKATTLIAGFALGLTSSLFLLGTSVWSPALDFLPSAMGVLVCASFNPTAQIRPLQAGCGVAMCAFLLLTKNVAGGVRRALSLRLTLSLIGSISVTAVFYYGQPQLQRGFENATMKWIVSSGSEANPLATQSRLGDLAELKLSSRVVMRVWTRSPQYLRGRVFAHFNGRVWQMEPQHTTPLQLMTSASTPAGLEDVTGNQFALPGQLMQDGASTRVFQTVASPGLLVAPAHVSLVRAPVDSVNTDSDGLLRTPISASVRLYGLVNMAGSNPENEQAGPDDLALPVDLDPRWRLLAQRLAEESGGRDPVGHTINYVKHAATYSLDVGEFRSHDPAAEFFFEKRRGYCQYFATAATLLLRSQGIPARYVTGYTVQEFNRPGGYYVVRDADAHAWVEVFVGGKGWIQADPTPEAEFQARRQTGNTNWVSQSFEWIVAVVSEVRVRVTVGDWRGALAALGRQVRSLLGWVVVPAVIAVAFLLWRSRNRLRRLLVRQRRRTNSADSPDQLQLYLEQVTTSWKRAGVPRAASKGLLEHTQEIETTVSPEFHSLSRRFVDEYYVARFSHQNGVDMESLELLLKELAQAASSKKRD